MTQEQIDKKISDITNHLPQYIRGPIRENIEKLVEEILTNQNKGLSKDERNC